MPRSETDCSGGARAPVGVPREIPSTSPETTARLSGKDCERELYTGTDPAPWEGGVLPYARATRPDGGNSAGDHVAAEEASRFGAAEARLVNEQYVAMVSSITSRGPRFIGALRTVSHWNRFVPGLYSGVARVDSASVLSMTAKARDIEDLLRPSSRANSVREMRRGTSK